MFYWSSKPETLDDLEDLLNEPPPAPGAPVGVSFPYLTGEVERLPVSINSSCPLDHDEKAEVQQQKQLCSSTLSPVEDKGSSWLQRLPGPELLAQPTSSAGAAGQHQATAATGSSDGWLSYVPGSSFIWSRPSSSETGSQIPSKTHVCSDSSVFGSQVGTTLAQPQPVAGGWLHYVPGSGLLVWMHSTDSSKAAATAASLIDAQSQEQRGQHSAIGNRGSTSGGQATATPTGWHLPNLHIPSLTWPSGSGTAKPAPQPEERELEVLHKKRSESAMPSMEGTPGEGGAGDKQQQQQQASALSSQLSAALHRSWHQAEAVVISPLGVSVLGAAVGGVVAGPLGVAVGAKAGAALVVGGALSGAAAHYATHWHPHAEASAQGGTRAPHADGSATQPQELVPVQVAACDPPDEGAPGSEELAEEPLVAGEGSPDSQQPSYTSVEGQPSLAT